MTTSTWTPSDRDRIIYKWVKFDGHKQSWVADQLGMNQSTVSRIIDRYERWIAHGGPAQQGALNRDERLRAQVALTFERNEWIIASCMRLAAEMERLSDISKSNIKHYCSDPTHEIEVNTEHKVRDNTAKADRYLRLAHRVGADQLKLIEKYDLPALEPLTLDPLTLDPNEYSQALADARSGLQSGDSPFVAVPPDEIITDDPDTRTRRACEEERSSTSTEPDPSADLAPSLPPSVSPSPTPPVATHTMHNAEHAQSPLTPTAPTVSLEISPHQKPKTHAYPVAVTPPETTGQLEPILDATAH